MPYSQTTWVNNTTPALNATNLNKLTNELASQAVTQAISHSLPTWANGVPPAVSDAAPLNEMERVAEAVAISLGNTYSKTTWQANWTPARNAANLNKLEAQAAANRTAIESGGPSFGTSLPARMSESGGSVFYVRTDGNDANTGTVNSAGGAWRNINKAFTTLTAGQICKVVAGTYSENITSTRNLGGPQPATIEAFDPLNKPILTGTIRFQNSGANAAGYWRIRNLIIDGLNQVAGVNDNASIKFTGSGTNVCPHHMELFGLEIRNTGKNNVLHQPQGISIQGGTNGPTNVPNHIQVWNCWIHDIGPGDDPIRSHCIYPACVDNFVFANNLCHTTAGWGWRGGGRSNVQDGVTNAWVVNNTFAKSSQAGALTIFADVNSAFIQSGNILMYNNIGRQGAQVFIQSTFTGGQSSAMNYVDANIAFGYSGVKLVQGEPPVSTTFTHDPVNTDPLFVDYANDNYHLQGGSPAVNAGLADYTPAFDLEGNARVTPDLGCYRA